MGPNDESAWGLGPVLGVKRGRLKASLDRRDTKKFMLYKPSSASSEEEAWLDRAET